MRMLGKAKLVFLASALLFSAAAWAQAPSFKAIQEQIAEYRKLLDQAGSTGSRSRGPTGRRRRCGRGRPRSRRRGGPRGRRP